MNKNNILTLSRLNEHFYNANSNSFSSTRKRAWDGWQHVLDYLIEGSIADVACGNMRFKDFINENSNADSFDYVGIDRCIDLVEDKDKKLFMECDIIKALLDCNDDQLNFFASTKFDNIVSFGFMHHIPTFELRKQFIEAFINNANKGGIVALSFWQFMNEQSIAKKAKLTTEQGQKILAFELEENDYLLGWGEEKESYRYCHHFSDEEIDELADAISDKAHVIEKFNADGRNQSMNRYLVLKAY